MKSEIPTLIGRKLFAALLLSSLLASATAPAAAEEASAPFITEAYYRIKWGHFEEFMELFKKNHFPILEKLQELDHIESMEAAFPVNHASEESRWDFRMTIVIGDTEAFARVMPKISKELYPDQEKLAREERHRFSLLTGHTDVVIRTEDLSTW